MIGETQEDIRHVFMEKAREEQSEIVFADAEFTVGKSSKWEAGTGKMCLDIFRNNTIYLSSLESPLGGNYQKKNIITVCAACEVLASHVGPVSAKDIRKGILNVIDNTGLAGRWQILSRVPLTICDTGHNEAGLTEVLDQISKTPHENLHFVFGLVNDKEIDKILKMLPKDATYYFCKADIPRGLDSNELRIKALGYGLTGEAFDSVIEALKAARQCAGINDLVFIGGSTFVVAEVV